MELDVTICRLNGAIFRSWSNGHSVGYEATFADGRPSQYVYLDASSERGGGIAVHIGHTGDPARDQGAVCARLFDGEIVTA